MRICIDTSPLRIRHTGIAVYTLELMEAMLGQLGHDECLVSFDPIGGFKAVSAELIEQLRQENDARLNRPLFRRLNSQRLSQNTMRSASLQRRIARILKEMRFKFGINRYDICHAVVTLPPGPTHKPVIPLVHDLSILRFPETHPSERVRAFHRWLPDILRAPIINTVSKYSRDEITRAFGYPADKIIVTHPGVSEFFFRNEPYAETRALHELKIDTNRLIILVGTQEPRKNISVVLAAFAALKKRVQSIATLLVIGGSGWGKVVIPPPAEPLIRSGQIQFTGYVSRLQLRALYRRAALLAFPSLYEGFGLPAAEALACGTPVAISSGTSLEEVTGPHGVRVASTDVDGWRLVIENALLAPAINMDEINARRAWAKQFDWKKTAVETLAMYRSLC